MVSGGKGMEARGQQQHRRGCLLGAYEMGRTVGEGSFGKVKHARHRGTGAHFAVKILDRARILALRIDDQIRREITTLKLLKHPNVVRLHEVAASKTKIYMVLEFVNGGELLDKIAIRGKLSEDEGRRLFQQLIDGVSYCHEKGVYHRDLKPENVLIDRKGNIKISDFGLSALPQHLGVDQSYCIYDPQNDGLLHTTCGSPNYIAPEILQNRGYDGSLSDIWVRLRSQSGFRLPHRILQRILEPNPMERIDMAGIKAHEWFRQNYIPVVPCDNDDEDSHLDAVLPVKEQINEVPEDRKTNQINAFQLIGMASSLDLSGFFEEELKVMQNCTGSKNPKNKDSTSFLVCIEVFELGPSLYVVEIKKAHGDPAVYRQLCERIGSELGVLKMEQIFGRLSVDNNVDSLDNRSATPLVAL
ncbi:hypothetical protein PR202_ga11177 [Eleusine coracana subsp. coracana]|uniref:non-specific serine/threonine protein kinase n=1 Tax=Eleusine coracana subsp. coracana TaxID=191504 RepID=A0AAV5C8P8_ELECO|nr:hypothetical protein PR202_ga11177 [Eleusine coracana subsp. coracana]